MDKWHPFWKKWTNFGALWFLLKLHSELKVHFLSRLERFVWIDCCTYKPKLLRLALKLARRPLRSSSSSFLCWFLPLIPHAHCKTPPSELLNGVWGLEVRVEGKTLGSGFIFIKGLHSRLSTSIIYKSDYK